MLSLMSVIHQHVPLLRQHPQLRQFLLTNLVEVEGRYVWRVNLEAISHHLEDIMSFPDFHKPYPGPTLFLGGSNSPYIRWDRKQVRGLTPRDPLQLLRVRGSPRRGGGPGGSPVPPAAGDTNTLGSEEEPGGSPRPSQQRREMWSDLG